MFDLRAISSTALGRELEAESLTNGPSIVFKHIYHFSYFVLWVYDVRGLAGNPKGNAHKYGSTSIIWD